MRWLTLLTLVAALVVVLGGPPPAGAQEAEVHLLVIEGVINPFTERYLSEGLRAAERAGAAAVVVRLNTPGGLERSMRAMTDAILNSPVPVVVWVAPPGARAASAGMFITIAAHVAAMAPGTNIGAAHPVSIGSRPGGEGGESETARKIVNDAAALARAVARLRARNAEWAEKAVRESVSISATEAVEQDVVDLVAADRAALLASIDGRRVSTPRGEQELRTAGARVVERPMSLPARILHTLTDPNIAFILFSLGFIGLIAELYNPGMLFPGIVGVISLILAFVAFSSLPINWAAVALLVLAVGLFVGELYTETFGILAAGGLVAFVLGALMLYDPFTPTSPAMPDVRVSPWLIALTTGAVASFFLVVVRALVAVYRRPATTGIEALIGRTGVAVSDLAPDGTVQVDTEVWRAVTESGRVRKGEEVEVTRVEGVTLRVRPRAAARIERRAA